MQQIDQKFDFKIVEQEVSSLWKKNETLIKKSLQFDSKKSVFSFLEGPPTANAPPALHHVEVRVFKDVMCRFKALQGFNVPRKGGWDCHGLPVEVQVEKKLGLNTKKDVVKYGIEKFNSECRKDIFTFIKKWEENTQKLAYWVDLEHPYRTLDNEYIESVWWSLKELFKKGHLYEGHKVVPYCPRCETPLSSHEVALGYKDVTDTTITVKFKLKNKNRFVLAWTTTPWTLPSNVCLAVNPKLIYAVVEDLGQEFILAKDLVKKYFGDVKIKEEFAGQKLVGLEYEPLFNYFKLEGAWRIVPEDYVSTEEGTGVVHQAPAFGEIDYESCKKHKLPFIQPVSQNGKFTEEVADFKELFVKDADPLIIKYLDEKGVLFKTEKYFHSYPFCWRCSTPLLYYATVSWFINVSSVRDKLVKYNKKIKWFPQNIQDGRFGKWLEGAKDWALSRSKFWGTPLPLWKCEKCKKIEAIGSIKELKEKYSQAKEDLHKPFVDEVVWNCSCNGLMKRIPDVIDCWYDSGSAPFAQLHYPFENKELFEKLFPYDFIAEAIDQTRGWFYTLHILGILLFDSVAYKRCAVGGLLCDDKGEKMSKSKGNIVQPDEMFDKVGVDVVRLLMCSYQFGENIRFGMQPINETINPFLRILWNSFYFYQNFAINFSSSSADALSLRKVSKKIKGSKRVLFIEDEWIISRVNTLIERVEGGLDNGQFNNSVSAIQNFVNEDLSRWYIKLVRDRASENDRGLLYTFNYVFERLLLVLAPFAPYITEYLYQKSFSKKESIHFEDWPKKEKIDETLEKNMTYARDVVSAINFAREKANLGLRWPVQTVTIVSDTKEVSASLKSLNNLVESQTNVKTINVVNKLKEIVEGVKANVGILGKTFGNKTPKIISKLSTESEAKILKDLSTKAKVVLKIDGKNIDLTKEHFIIERKYPSHLIEAQFANGLVYLDTTRSKDLDSEGYAREATRRVQELRKKAGLKRSDEINLLIKVDSEMEQMLSKWYEVIKQKTGSKNLTITTKTDKPHGNESKEVIKEKELSVCFEKV